MKGEASVARLIMWNLMTLDGFVEGPNRDISWHFDVWGEELERLSIEQLKSAGGLMFGRVTYELMASHWPSAAGEVADLMNALPKYVFSPRWRTRIGRTPGCSMPTCPARSRD
jgi:dihydrofolate reductase